VNKRNSHKEQHRKGGAPSQPTAPTPPPTVEGSEDDKEGDGGGNGTKYRNYEEKPPHWASYIEATCAVLLVIITAFYTHYAYQQAGAAITAAAAAKSAADTAANSLELANRPWIQVVGITPGGNVSLPALVFRGKNTDKFAFAYELQFNLELKNVGTAVAINTRISVFPLIRVQDPMGDQKSILNEESKTCESARQDGTNPNYLGAIVIFPSDTHRHEYGVGYGIDERDIEHLTNPPYNGDYVPLSVGGCVTYQSPVSNKVYQTRFIYDLSAYDSHLRDFNGIIPLGVNFPSSGIRFISNDPGYYAR